MAEQDPQQPSSDYEFMYPFWRMVRAILGGAPAMRSAKGADPLVAGPAAPVANLWQLDRSGRVGPLSPYLPKFLNESDISYKLRRENAPLTNIYADISRNLAAKPFAKTCELDEKTSQDLKDLADDIDGQGHNLHFFAADIFRAAIDNGITWILTDYTKVDAGATLADERGMGARPYWLHITADRLLAVYSAFVNGNEIITHARIDECYVKQVGYAEEHIECVRVLNRDPIVDVEGKTVGYGLPTYAVYESVQKDAPGQNANKATSSQEWQLTDQGLITVGYIPLVPIIFGRRHGMTWKVDPPLKDLAYLQVEEFQQESNLKTIKELTAFPMLAGNGVQVPVDAQGQQIQIGVGPHTVLISAPDANGTHGTWSFIEPAGSSLTFLAADLEKIRTEMRDLGMQPLQSANLTVITTANVAMRAHSAVQAWALILKDRLEEAWLYTCDWLGKSDKPVVNVHTDFGVDITGQTELDALLKCQAQGILSKQTIQMEFKRRGVLADDFDPDEEEQILAEEDQGLTPEVAIDPATGQLVHPLSRPKILTAPPTLPAGSAAAPPPTQQR